MKESDENFQQQSWRREALRREGEQFAYCRTVSNALLQAAISPIRKLPEEILREIFEPCISEIHVGNGKCSWHGNNMSPGHCRGNISQVCRPWKYILDAIHGYGPPSPYILLLQFAKA